MADLVTDLITALKAADSLCTHALPKFNWGASALDAQAIQLLNEVPRQIQQALARAEKARRG